MDIRPISKTEFKGYDARPLRGFLMSSNCHGIADELKKIGKKEGFKVFSLTRPNSSLHFRCSETLPPKSRDITNLWAQDLWTIIKGKLLTRDVGGRTYAIKDYFDLQFDPMQHKKHSSREFTSLTKRLWQHSANTSFSRYSPLHREKYSPDEIAKMRTELCELKDRSHISGGNIFIIKNKTDEVIIGERELINFSTSEIKSMYGVEKVIPLPQMDFHLDLFIRPLDNKRILLADDSLTTIVLKGGLNKLKATYKNYPSPKLQEAIEKIEHFIKNWEHTKINSSNQHKKKVINILNKNGYEVIPTPGRIYDTYSIDEENLALRHHCNYMNANVLKNKSGDLVYITNKSHFDKMLGLTSEIITKCGFSFEDAFIKSILPFVKREHIYFVNGKDNFISTQMLPELQGGIHCVCTEIPTKTTFGERDYVKNFARK